MKLQVLQAMKEVHQAILPLNLEQPPLQVLAQKQLATQLPVLQQVPPATQLLAL